MFINVRCHLVKTKLIQAWDTIHPQLGTTIYNSYWLKRLRFYQALANAEKSSFSCNHSSASNFLSKTDHVMYSAASASAHLQTS